MAVSTSSLLSILFCSPRCILFLTKTCCNIFHFSIPYKMLPCLLLRVEHCLKALVPHLVLLESLYYILFLKVSQEWFFHLFLWTSIKFNASGIILWTETPTLCTVLLPIASPAWPGHSTPLSTEVLSRQDRSTVTLGSLQAGLLYCHFGSRLRRVTTCRSQLQYLLAKGFEEGVKRKTRQLLQGECLVTGKGVIKAGALENAVLQREGLEKKIEGEISGRIEGQGKQKHENEY